MIAYRKIAIIVGCMLFISKIILAQSMVDLNSEIYSKLRDRRCNMPLNTCNCPDAREMKAYIEALAETGISKDEIFYKVAKKFSLNTILDKQIKEIVEARLLNEAGKNRPKIIVEPTSFDFGNASKKQGKISHSFKIFNKGNAPLIINNIRTLCPCTLVSLGVGKIKSPYFGTQGSPANWQIQIKPNGVGNLEVVLDLLDPSANLGTMKRSVLIMSNDPVYPEINVQIEVNVTN